MDTMIDREIYDQLVASTGNDPAFMRDLTDTYLHDAPDLVAQMRRALQTADADVFRRAAHSLKSNSANFGATVLSGMARELEMMGKAGTLYGAEEKICCAEQELQRVSAELIRLVCGGPDAD